MYQQMRPTWAEVNLDHIAHNTQAIKQKLSPSCEIIAVVKANAYGHGAIAVARAALEAGATRLAVSILDEALELRQAGISAPILVMGYTPASQGGTAACEGVSLTVYEQQQALALVASAQAAGQRLKVHLKVETGMGRIGVQPSGVVRLAGALYDLPGCELEGIFTHFARADEPELAPTLLQLESFNSVLKQLEQAGMVIPLVHVANSAAAMRLPQSQLTAVRLGIAMYGIFPSAVCRQQGYDLRPAMALKTIVTHAKWVSTGTAIGYGGSFIAPRSTYIVTLPIGYADGLSRALGGRGFILVNGKKVPLVGSVCMDQCMADATEAPETQVGDEVLIWGESQGQSLDVVDTANRIDTIPYELLSLVSARVPRVYLRHGKVTGLLTLLH